MREAISEALQARRASFAVTNTPSRQGRPRASVGPPDAIRARPIAKPRSSVAAAKPCRARPARSRCSRGTAEYREAEDRYAIAKDAFDGISSEEVRARDSAEKAWMGFHQAARAVLIDETEMVVGRHPDGF
jgi:hypothetical protein